MMTPGFAKARAELPGLPYPEKDRVIINAHNFTTAWTPAVNEKNPIAAWVPSRDTSGNGTTTLTDLVGSNDGTLTNMDAATDWVEDTDAGGVRALEFDGSNDYVDAGTALSISGSLSIQAWAKASSTTGLGMIANRSSDNSPFPQNYILYRDGAVWKANVKSGSYYVVTGPTVTLNTWTHLVLVVDGSTMKLYVNGTAYSIALTTAPDTSGTQRLYIGAQFKAPFTRPFAGRIDDVRLWNQAIDATDVTDLYASGSGRGVQA